MAAKRITRSKTVDVELQHLEENETQVAQDRNRAKKYSADECKVLLVVCNKYHTILNVNSSRDVDKKNKQNAWQNIKKEFDVKCKSEGIYVSSSHLVFYSYISVLISLFLDKCKRNAYLRAYYLV